MSRIKLICSDLDGTLLNEEKNLSERTLCSIRAAQSRGVIFVPASGRPLQSMRIALRKILDNSENGNPPTSADNVVIVSDNGALAVRGDTEIYSKVIAKESWKEVVAIGRFLKSTGVLTIVIAKRGAFVEDRNPSYSEQVICFSLFFFVFFSFLCFFNFFYTDQHVLPSCPIRQRPLEN